MRKIGMMLRPWRLLVGLNFAMRRRRGRRPRRPKSKAPAGWKNAKARQQVPQSINSAFPKSDGDKEDAELVVFFFGKGGGGTNEDNIKRWKGQFIAPPEGNRIEVDQGGKFQAWQGRRRRLCRHLRERTNPRFPPFDPNAKEIRKENFRRYRRDFR